MPRSHHISVERTARWYTLGEPGPRTGEVWFVLHGYGQLAEQFIGYCAALDDGTRYVVAPEALNRFYLVAPGDAPASERPVGATWMTREDREREIGDYVAYLDALYDRVFESLPRDQVHVRVMGFSQATATAARWVVRGARVEADDLVLWAGLLPPDIDLSLGKGALVGVPLTVVVGSRDQYATPAAVAEQDAKLRAAGIEYRLHRFEGGHAIPSAVLRDVAAALG